MELKREEIVKVVIKALQEAQRDITDELEEINESTRPIGDLQSFDSLTSVDVTLQCLDDLGYPDHPGFPTLFINKDREALTVGEVAEKIMKLKQKN